MSGKSNDAFMSFFETAIPESRVEDLGRVADQLSMDLKPVRLVWVSDEDFDQAVTAETG